VALDSHSHDASLPEARVGDQEDYLRHPRPPCVAVLETLNIPTWLITPRTRLSCVSLETQYEDLGGDIHLDEVIDAWSRQNE
jgi:hypothetical protein